jgi:hypothetical protein
MLQRHLHYARERRPIPLVPGSQADLKVGRSIAWRAIICQPERRSEKSYFL